MRRNANSRSSSVRAASRNCPAGRSSPAGTQTPSLQQVRQVHPRVDGLQGVHRPAPPVRRLEHHFAALTGPGHHLSERVRTVGDPDRLQHVTLGTGPHGHGASSVQVDAHILLTHVTFYLGPPSSLAWSTSSIRAEGYEERGPAPFIASR